MNERLREILKGKNTAYLMLLTGLGIILLVVYNNMVKHTNKVEDDFLFADVSSNIQMSNASEGFANELENRLELIFSRMAGVGEVKVMVTLVQGPEIVVATEVSTTQSNTTENDGTGGMREVSNMSQDTSFVSIGNTPLILTEKQPKVEGVIVVAQGGGNIRVVEAITNAVRAILGIEANRVVVLEMQGNE